MSANLKQACDQVNAYTVACKAQHLYSLTSYSFNKIDNNIYNLF